MPSPQRRLLPLLFLAGLLGGCSVATKTTRLSTPGGSPAVSYVVSLPNPSNEMFHVEGTLENLAADTLTINFPIWTPGAYDLVYFGNYVRDITAHSSDGRELVVIRSDSNSVRIVGTTPVTFISYNVHDIEQRRGAPWFGISDIEPEFAFAVGTALFGYPEGQKRVPHSVRYDVPKGWDYTVSLDPAGEPNTFLAPGYDELIDAPVQMGKFQRLEFIEGGKPHLITVSATRQLPDSISRELIDRTRNIVQMMSGFFGEMPYERYIFQIYLVDPSKATRAMAGSFGALEHAASSTYLMPWFSENHNPVTSLEDVIAHEYWHLWSPKRFHVAELGPFDYQRAPTTTSLWFAEGLTEYYCRLLLQRDEPERIRRFLGAMQRDLAAFHGIPQRGSITSFSRGIATVGFENIRELYTKGPILGLLLDATIRIQTGNRKSLDDAMLHFNREYGQTGRTFGDDDIIPIMERVTGASLASFYNRYIDGLEPLPIDELLPKMGLSFRDSTDTLLALGVTAEISPDKPGVRITAITPRGSADSMGLRVGDILVRYDTQNQPMDLKSVPMEFFNQISSSTRFMQRVRSVTYLRDGVESTVEARIIPTAVIRKRLALDPAATPEALAIRRAMFGV